MDAPAKTRPTIDDIRAAAQRIDGAVVKTPMLHSRVLSDLVEADIWLKFENLQFTSAYKERGALNKLLQLNDEERRRGVIAASAGNHAQAVAYHGRRLGIPVTIVMPKATPTVKVTQTESHGARVVLHGAMFDDAYARARELEAEVRRELRHHGRFPIERHEDGVGRSRPDRWRRQHRPALLPPLGNERD